MNDSASGPTRSPLRVQDKVIIGLLGFFILVAVTWQLYSFVFHEILHAMASRTDFMARSSGIYGQFDRRYFDRISPYVMSFEGFHLFVVTPLSAWLIYAILKARPYRHALQLTTASYVTLSCSLYFLEAHLSGYANMIVPVSAGSLFGFYAPNVPWLLANLYLTYDSAMAITSRARFHLAGAAL